MTTNIFYFSGTNNTKKVAQTLCSELQALGVTTNLTDVSKPYEHTPCDTIVIAYPVYGFNPPSIILDFVKNLPEDLNRVYFLKTSGEPLHINDASSLKLMKILRKKGYKVMGEYHFIMPYNMIFKHTDELASKMFLTAKERLKTTAKEISNYVNKPIDMPYSAKFMRALCTIEHKGMALNGKLYRVDDTKCINCMRCVNNCPVKNISYNGENFTFGSSCLGCARCSFLCPTDAITTGLLNFLKVNGAYNFNADHTKATLPKYCKKSYERYFSVENK